MGSKAPPIPPAQRSSPGEKPHVAGSAHPVPHGNSAISPKEQGRHGNIRHQQDR